MRTKLRNTRPTEEWAHGSACLFHLFFDLFLVGGMDVSALDTRSTRVYNSRRSFDPLPWRTVHLVLAHGSSSCSTIHYSVTIRQLPTRPKEFLSMTGFP